MLLDELADQRLHRRRGAPAFEFDVDQGAAIHRLKYFAQSRDAFAQTGIEHAPLSYFVAGKRINVEARIADPKGVKVARTYFRAGAQADYTFVPMQ